MKKSIASILLMVMLMLTGASSTFAALPAANDATDIYTNVVNVNLQNLDLSIMNEDIQISKKNDAVGSKDDNNLKYLIDNAEFKKNLKDLIKKGYRPIKIAVKEVYVERTYDSGNKVTSERFLTNAEVQALNEKPEGSATIVPMASYSNSYTKDKLTLVITVSTGTTNEYWVQSNATWATIVGTLGSGTPAPGEDFIATGWNSKFNTKSNPSGGGQYFDGTSISPYVEDINPTGGTVWRFNDYKSYGTDFTLSKSIYAGVGVRDTTAQPSYCSFTAHYGHTYNSMSYSASISTGGASLSVSPTTDSWKIAVSVSGNF